MKILILIVASFAFMGCEKRSSVPSVELIQDMHKDASFKAQDYDPDKKDKRANMLPPEGTVPQGAWEPYPNFQTDTDAKNYPNPVKFTTDILAKGSKKYQIYCSVCHGTSGHGNGTVADKMLVKPPSLVTEKIRGWTDGQLFHLVTRGRGMMKGYEQQIPSIEERWAIVHYIRHLQKNQKVDPAPGATNN